MDEPDTHTSIEIKKLDKKARVHNIIIALLGGNDHFSVSDLVDSAIDIDKTMCKQLSLKKNAY